MKTEPCWFCGAQPISITKHAHRAIPGLWTRLECCTAGQWTTDNELTVESWNCVQAALTIQRTLELLDIPAQQFIDLNERIQCYVNALPSEANQ